MAGPDETKDETSESKPENTVLERSSEVNDETALLYELVRDSHILTPVVMIGASALIPVPFLDDAAKAYLEKYLFALLAEREGLELSKDEKLHLTHEPRGGCCAWGCLGSALLYPLKKLLRKIFFFLEIKRAVDQATTALAQAYLFRFTLRQDLWKPGETLHHADCVRRAIAEACNSHGVKPLETAIRHGFDGAKGTLADFAAKFAKKSSDDEKEMKEAVDSLEREEKDEIAGLTRRLTSSLDEVEDTYVAAFAKNFQQKLAQEKSKPPEPETA